MTDDELIGQYIEQHPRKGGLDEARLKGYGISVWATAGELQAPGVSLDELAYGFDIPLDAIRAAAVYYARHKLLIDNRLLANVPEPEHTVAFMRAIADASETGNAAMTDEELIAQFIEPNPHKGGLDEAVIRETLVPVWAIVGYLEVAHGDVDDVADGFEVSPAAIKAVRAFYLRHKCIIDNRIAANALP